MKFNAILVALALLLSGCLVRQEPFEVHGYSYGPFGGREAAFVFQGFDERNCAVYRLAPMEKGVRVPRAVHVWDGSRFTRDRSQCKPFVTPRPEQWPKQL
ncbi:MULTISPECIES: hypothetical protein [unclassified Thioalkalivibrio]|uniref:hypothetical protein n=1 Tax=unclassified Thioalkalivibrio TaxID=2621013 RepID=UPI001E52F946|nr:MULTISPECIES: hypothetical protein [unclassified Thioalkalivibrio]